MKSEGNQFSCATPLPGGERSQFRSVLFMHMPHVHLLFWFCLSLFCLKSGAAQAQTYYVNRSNSAPVYPYTNWATAATNIQDAVDAATVGGLVLVTNGIYDTGGKAVYGLMTNRVAIDKAITLKSVNGPGATWIVGSGAGGGNTNSDGAIRCVYMWTNAVLIGFTLTNGHTRASGDTTQEQSGGGVWSASTNAWVTNCLLAGNSAKISGGGAFNGTLNNCVFTGNSATNGGGANNGTLNNCTLTGNSASSIGGGAYGAKLNNCILYYNTAPSSSNYNTLCTLKYCCTTPAPPSGTGNITNEPVMVDRVNGNLRLQSTSPCINSGNNASVSENTDLDGQPRLAGGTVDIGAYEFQTPASIISYAWLMQFSFSLYGSDDNVDSDGDGLSNWQEWLLGTNPRNALSLFKIDLSFLTNGSAKITFNSVANGYYMLESSTNTTLWTPIIAIIPSSSNTALLDATATNAGRTFYRVRAEVGPLSVYSTNTVGFNRQTLTMGGNLIGYPFLRTNATLNALLPGVPEDTMFYKVDSNGQFAFSMYWGMWDFDQTFRPGEGAAIYTSSGLPFTLTQSGDLPLGFTFQIPAGLSLWSSVAPRGLLASQLHFPSADGDIIYKYDVSNQVYEAYRFYAAEPAWHPCEPVLDFGEAFWVRTTVGKTWVYDPGSYALAGTAYLGGPDWWVPTAGTAPQITQQPQSRTNVTSDTVTFNATASGTAPFAYQWRFAGTNLVGATNRGLTLTNVQRIDAGEYTVVVVNAYGSVTSAVTTLTLWYPPEITGQPQNQTNVVGTPANFSVTASGTPPLNYQWLKNETNISNATNSAFSLQPAVSGDAGNYRVVVTNAYGSVTSAVATLTLWYPPEITGQPQNQTNAVGTTASFSVTASGTAPLYYQWFKDATPLNNALAPTLTLTNAQATDAGNYWVLVTNFVGTVTSDAARLNIAGMPQLYVNGVLVISRSLCVTGSVQLAFQTSFSNATLYYSLDGSSPNNAYTLPLTLASSATIRAVAWDENWIQSVELPPIMITVVPTYSLSLATTPGGSLQITPTPGPYFSNTVVTITATASNGWSLMNWTGDTNGVTPVNGTNLLVTMDQNKTIGAMFGTPLITTFGPPGAGMVRRQPDQALYAYGSTVRLSVMPTNGYYLAYWGGAAGPVGTVTNSPLNFTVTNAAPSVSAVFALLATNYYSLTVQCEGDGMVVCNPARSYYSNGQAVTLTAAAASNAVFLNWSNEISSAQNPLSLIMTNSKVITAWFGNSGGTGTNAVGTNSFLTVVAPGLTLDTNSSLRLYMQPADAATAGAQWRLAWENTWRNSGATLSGLGAGNYEVVFKPVAGWQPPANEVLPVGSNTLAQYTRYYSPAAWEAGQLTVSLYPSNLAGAQWRMQGDSIWHDSDFSLSNLVAGLHILEFKPVAGWATPPARQVLVAASQNNLVEATYLVDTEYFPGDPRLPVKVYFEDIIGTAYNQLPYGFNGQLRSDAGVGCGFVVKQHVVVTAAHLVFNDATLNYATGLRWYFQRHAASYEPQPQTPRGWYVFAGYAAQRTNENNPGIGSLASQNLDVAALYFLEPAGRGGYGGYLVSSAGGAEWLLTNSLKMLIGYPVEGVNAMDIGKMHASGAYNLHFNPLTNRVFMSLDFRSYPGNSGGPLCVQHTNGYYYPAGIYLGGSGKSVVRAIDGEVADLIGRAELSGNDDQNHTGGGVLTIVNHGGSGGFNPGWVQVQLGPTSAVARGGAWRVSPTNTFYSYYTNYTTSSPRISAQNSGFTIEFRPVPGFVTPTGRVVQVTSGQGSIIQANYWVLPPNMRLLSSSLTNLGIWGTEGTQYRIEYTTNLANRTNWFLHTNLTLGAGTNAVTLPMPTNDPNRFYRALWVP